jgi:voltage-gated potassium channel
VAAAEQEDPVMARLNPVERQFASFMRQPLSVRKAMAVIATATLVSVIVGGVLMTLLDHDEFPDVGTGLWWALQTVTTVGYGDVVPANPVGRLLGAAIMLESIAFISIVTAAITSSFVERARREQAAKAGEPATHEAVARVSNQLAEITARLERIEDALAVDGSRKGHRG